MCGGVDSSWVMWTMCVCEIACRVGTGIRWAPDADQAASGMWSAVCGLWDMECGAWDVVCGVSNAV